MRTKHLPVLFYLLIFSFLISTYFSRVQYQSLLQTNLYLLIPLSFIAGIILSDSKHLSSIIKIVTLSTILISTYYFYQEYHFSLNLVSSGRRFLGPFGWHNQQGALMLISLPISMSFYLKHKSKLWLVASFLSTFFFLTTYSRASWLSLSLSVTLYIYINYKNVSQKTIMQSFYIFATIFLISLLFTPTRKRIQSIINFSSSSNYSTSERLRTEALFVGIRMIKDYPLIGIGPGVYGSAYPAYQTSPWLYSRFPHNQLLQYFIELGLTGGVTFLSIFYLIFSSLYKKRSKIFSSQIHSVLFITTVALTIHSLLDIDQNITFFIITYWIMLGILYQPTKIKALKNFQSLITPLTIIIICLSLYSKLIPNPFYQNLRSDNLDQAIKENPFSAEPHFFKALAFETQGDYKSAQKQYLLAIQKNPYSHPKYHMNLAALQLNLNNPQAAELILMQAATKYFPKNQDYIALSHLENHGGFEKDLSTLYNAYKNVKALNH